MEMPKNRFKAALKTQLQAAAPYPMHAVDSVRVLVQVETQAALDNIEAICAVGADAGILARGAEALAAKFRQ